MLTQYGEVDNTEPEVNDPDSELQPYTALEFELLRLTMLTDIAPRVVKTMNDSEAIKLFAPKQKSRRSDTEKSRERQAEKRRGRNCDSGRSQVRSSVRRKSRSVDFARERGQ